MARLTQQQLGFFHAEGMQCFYVGSLIGNNPPEYVRVLSQSTVVILLLLPSSHQVNVAVIIDSSGSVSASELLLEIDFAKKAVASFASRNLFTNGGTASYASFATSVSEGGTFSSTAEFDEFVDNDPRASGGSTNIAAGLSKGRELLNADESATASFLILITDGDWNTGSDPQVCLVENHARSLATTACSWALFRRRMVHSTNSFTAVRSPSIKTLRMLWLFSWPHAARSDDDKTSIIIKRTSV